MIDLQRAPNAFFRLAGPHHEMFDEQLAATVEELGEGHLARGPVKDVVLLDPNPRQRSLFCAQLIAQSGERLLFLASRATRAFNHSSRDTIWCCIAHPFGRWV